jgi:hypothetical protein
MSPIEEYRKFLAEKGRSLEDLGLAETALLREDALAAISLIRQASVPILGGDVYMQDGTDLFPAHANWSCDPTRNEKPDEYLARSWSVAESYIKNYPPDLRVITWFVLVIGRLVIGS